MYCGKVGAIEAPRNKRYWAVFIFLAKALRETACFYLAFCIIRHCIEWCQNITNLYEKHPTWAGADTNVGKLEKKTPATTAAFFHTLYAVIHNPSCSHMFNISRPFFVLEEYTVNKVLLLPSSAHKSTGPRPHPLFAVSTLSDTPMIATIALTVWMRDESYFPYCWDVINLWKKN